MFGDYGRECTNKTMRGDDERQKAASSLITCRFSARFFDSKMLEKQKDVDSFVISSGRDFHYGKTRLSWVIVRERKP